MTCRGPKGTPEFRIVDERYDTLCYNCDARAKDPNPAARQQDTEQRKKEHEQKKK
jgi:hypothetical protein